MIILIKTPTKTDFNKLLYKEYILSIRVLGKIYVVTFKALLKWAVNSMILKVYFLIIRNLI